MSRAAYSKRTCWQCKREISVAGLAQHNHMMAHVRRGEAEIVPAKDIFAPIEFRWIKKHTK
jgi:hypothetical protein